MNYYYDPILGLQYTYLGNCIIMDIDKMSNNISIKEIIGIYQQQGIFFIDNYYNMSSINVAITNYML